MFPRMPMTESATLAAHWRCIEHEFNRWSQAQKRLSENSAAQAPLRIDARSILAKSDALPLT
jgi:hypothetical protein